MDAYLLRKQKVSKGENETMKKRYSVPELNITLFGDGIRTAQVTMISGIDDGRGNLGTDAILKLNAGITQTIKSNTPAAVQIIQFND